MANETSADGRFKKGYSSFQGGGCVIYAPLAYHNYSQNGYTWDSGVIVQNISSQPTTATVYFYNSNGTLSGLPVAAALNARGTAAVFAPQNGFNGSVLIIADQDIVAVVNVTNNAATGDTHAIYNASNR